MFTTLISEWMDTECDYRGNEKSSPIHRIGYAWFLEFPGGGDVWKSIAPIGNEGHGKGWPSVWGPSLL